MNLIVLRGSPDWETFDLDDSRSFCRRSGMPETLIIDFVDIWDRSFKLDFRTIRSQLKDIAKKTIDDVADAEVATAFSAAVDWSAFDRMAFVDDDDWMAPLLFDSLPSKTDGEDGIRWGSIRVGEPLDGQPHDSIVFFRATDHNRIGTNNYAVNDRTIKRYGIDSVFEHYHANKIFNEDNFRLNVCDSYLSAAVKHPCCTMSAQRLMESDLFRSDPHAALLPFARLIEADVPPVQPAWLAPPLQQFKALMRDALKSK